ncbi:MAG: hypothetical protein H3C35_03795 [Bacteroidetes bacterium]|nr:hypothetical protein [Bacteroidota bacterium]
MNLIYTLYNDKRTVFRLKDAAMLAGETNFVSLNLKLNYYVRTGKLKNPRKGIYCKPTYSTEELACKIFAPAYISLEYVLQKAGVTFQYDSRVTVVSYVSRNIEIENKIFSFRKIKNNLLVDARGIERQTNGVNIAAPERAFLDILYLNGETHFDNLNPLKREKIEELLSLYQSKALAKRVKKIYGHQ